MWLHSVYLILHDITARDEISHTFSHCTCRCTVAVFKVCIQVQAGRFYMRDINVLFERGVWRILVPWKISQATLKVIKRWWKIKANGMRLFQMKLCPQKCLIFADFNWTLGDTHEQLDKNIVPDSQSHCLILEVWTRWLKRDWTANQLQSHFMQNLQPRTFFDYKSQTRMPLILFAYVD